MLKIQTCMAQKDLSSCLTSPPVQVQQAPILGSNAPLSNETGYRPVHRVPSKKSPKDLRHLCLLKSMFPTMSDSLVDVPGEKPLPDPHAGMTTPPFEDFMEIDSEEIFDTTRRDEDVLASPMSLDETTFTSVLGCMCKRCQTSEHTGYLTRREKRDTRSYLSSSRISFIKFIDWLSSMGNGGFGPY